MDGSPAGGGLDVGFCLEKSETYNKSH